MALKFPFFAYFFLIDQQCDKAAETARVQVHEFRLAI